MNGQLDDDFLYQHISAAEKLSVDEIPAEEELDHAFSHRFLRKMDALVKYERRSFFGRFAAQLGRVAAAAVVIGMLLNTVLVVGVDAYRDQFFDITQTVTEKFTAFFVTPHDDAPVTELIPIDPPYIPEGFELVEQFNDGVSHDMVYRNPEGQEINYSQCIITTGTIHIDTEDAAEKWIQIEDCSVYVVVENGTTQLHWFDGDYRFLVIGNADYESFIAVAEGIIKNRNFSLIVSQTPPLFRCISNKTKGVFPMG